MKYSIALSAAVTVPRTLRRGITANIALRQVTVSQPGEI